MDEEKIEISEAGIVADAFKRIGYIHELIESYLVMCRFLENKYGQKSGKHNTGNTYELLIEKELDEWRGLMMWGLVVDGAIRDRIKAAAHDRFLSERVSVNKWWNDGQEASHWYTSTEEEFREMARKAFAPKDKP